jgi:hypothetical protein
VFNHARLVAAHKVERRDIRNDLAETGEFRAGLLAQFERASQSDHRADRCLPKRIVATARERQRLLRFGRPVGPAINELITIVTPSLAANATESAVLPAARHPFPVGFTRRPVAGFHAPIDTRATRACAWV